MSEQMVRSGSFKDINGESVKFRVWDSGADFRPYVCEVQRGSEWVSLGTRSLSIADARNSARDEWNLCQYDEEL